MVAVPIPGFTTDIRASDDGAAWKTVCAAKYDPDNAGHVAGWEKLCRKKLGFTDLPPQSVPPSDYARADVFMERLL